MLSAVIALAAPARAQVAPNNHWVTLRTQHFYITFTPELDQVARRAAVDAERAYAQLSQHLHPPRGMIDIIISDDVDYTNGSATPFPYGHITLYANPPVFESALRFVDDPTQLVISHELTHIFHLDRVGGMWKPLQTLFGRNPFTFPNLYQPSWLVEGIAVYYESQLTGSGRLAGSEHRMIARSAAIEHNFPRIDQLSLANPHFPYGYSVYAYGSLFVDYLARTHGDSSIRAFIESASRQVVPVLLNFPARRAFGHSFTSEYNAWARALVASQPPSQPPMPGWRDLTIDGAYTAFPRWLSDSTIVYTGAPARETYGAYRLTFSLQPPASSFQLPASRDGQRPFTADTIRELTAVTRDRIGRRNSRSPNSILADGSLLYSQLEYTSPYHLRSDLYVDRKRGGTTRLTHGARLAFPDARADGLIVAVHTLPGATQLVLVSSDGKRVTPITTGSPDEQWTEPRWSPDGRHIAAVRWTRGGTSAIVVIDTTGRIEQTLIRERVVNATPAWSTDGRFVYFSSDRTGVTNLYRAQYTGADSAAPTPSGAGLVMLSDAQTGLFEPQTSPSSNYLAAVVFRADGYHVGVAPLDSTRPPRSVTIDSVEPRELPLTINTNAVATKYSPWRTLRPRYWVPFVEFAQGSATQIGGYTSGVDLVGRHAYEALLLVPTDNSGITASLAYRNASLGQPLIDVAASEDWAEGPITFHNAPAGTLHRRTRDASLALTVTRPRVRTYGYFSIAGGIESRDYATDPPEDITLIGPLFLRRFDYPRLAASAGWSNTQAPQVAISPEDGVALASTARFRWLNADTTVGAFSLVNSAAGYKSLDFPGYAHHVLALRGAYGYMTPHNPDYFGVGGVSGGTLDLLPGYTLGEGRRTFAVRGFPASTLIGTRAASGTAEYRAPLTLPGRGLGMWPAFLDRTSVIVFGDAASAWCPRVSAPHAPPIASLCTQPDVDDGVVYLTPKVIASAGAELNVTAAALSWDTPFRYRLGVAAPVAGRTLSVEPVNSLTVYVAVGASF